MSASGVYVFRAMRKDGSVEAGTFDARSPVDARTALERRGLIVMEVRQVETPRERRAVIGAADLALGLRMLGDLLQAGLPVNRALQTLDELAPSGWKSILPHVKQSIREGKSLGVALRDAPVEISPLVIGMALAGEAAGDVAAAVRRAADVTESIAETRAAVRAALAYPVVLAVAGAGSIALMVGVVVPRFATILGDLGQALPRSTQLVMNGAAAIRAAFLPAVGACLVAAVALRAWTATDAGRRRWHSALLRIPLVGAVRNAAATARTTFTLATLLETGVHLRQALRLAARASGDAAICARVIDASARIEAGSPIGAALRDTAAVTPLALRLAQAGEESGRLATMLRHAAKLEQQRSDGITRAAVRLLEPALILVFAGVVALVAAALLQAVYSVRPAA